MSDNDDLKKSFMEAKPRRTTSAASMQAVRPSPVPPAFSGAEPDEPTRPDGLLNMLADDKKREEAQTLAWNRMAEALESAVNWMRTSYDLNRRMALLNLLCVFVVLVAVGYIVWAARSNQELFLSMVKANSSTTKAVAATLEATGDPAVARQARVVIFEAKADALAAEADALRASSIDVERVQKAEAEAAKASQMAEDAKAEN